MDAPRIVIGLADDIASKLADTQYDPQSLLDIARHFVSVEGRLDRLLSLLIEPMYAGIRATRLIEDDAEQPYDPADPPLRAQARLEEEIEAEIGRPVPTLLGLFVLELNGPDEQAAKELLRRLRDLIKPDPATGKPDLATAYVEQEVGPARGHATGAPAPIQRHPPDFEKQVYLTTHGINLPVSNANGSVARWRHYDGTDIQFIDIEEGWNVNHEAFDQKVRDEGPPTGAAPWERAHGNAALGIVLARGAHSRIRGIAPGCTLKGLYALRDERGPKKKRIETAIRLAVKNLRAGDVLLLELQVSSSRLPVEVDPGVFAAIQLAVAKGIVVIEPAGNAGSVLEDHRHDTDFAPGWTDNKDEGSYHGFPDSGAIIVGGCEVAEYGGVYSTPSRDVGTRGGARIDCCAWSKQVWTSFSDHVSGYDNFGGTSSASAIIAGVAVLVQQYAKERLGKPLTPGRMRELLRDPACGSPVQLAHPGQAVSMPDVCKLFKKIDEDAS